MPSRKLHPFLCVCDYQCDLHPLFFSVCAEHITTIVPILCLHDTVMMSFFPKHYMNIILAALQPYHSIYASHILQTLLRFLPKLIAIYQEVTERLTIWTCIWNYRRTDVNVLSFSVVDRHLIIMTAFVMTLSNDKQFHTTFLKLQLHSITWAFLHIIRLKYVRVVDFRIIFTNKSEKYFSLLLLR